MRLTVYLFVYTWATLVLFYLHMFSAPFSTPGFVLFTWLLNVIMAVCNICLSRLQSHSCYLSCSVCEDKYHINCLPCITKNDSIYMERNLSQWICTRCSQDIFPFNHCENDDDFIESLSGLWNIKPTNSFSKASDKLFLPFELNTSTDSPLYDVDPDLNVYCNFHNTYIPLCDYYSEDTFNSMCKNNTIVDSQLSLIHSNIRSIPSNLNSFISYLENLSITFTIMAFTETWLKEYNNEVHGVLGYNAVHHCRPQKKVVESPST